MLFLFFLLPALSIPSCSWHGLWPLPRECHSHDEYNLELDASFAINTDSKAPPLLDAIKRYEEFVLTKVDHRTRGYVEPHFVTETAPAPTSSKYASLAGLDIIVVEEHKKKTIDTDESYTLEVAVPRAKIVANTTWGALYGLEAFSQLVTYNRTRDGLEIRGSPVRITDRPRYPWRGVMIDTANHFMTMRKLREIVDTMSYHKMNLLHWHIVDSYSFPWQSPSFPELSAHGAWSDRAVYSPDNVRELVAYAMHRGIMLIVELDVPGHAYSWGLAYPHLTVKCPEQVSTDIGPINVVPLNPILNETWHVVETLLGELAHFFPGEFLHVGGDEVQLECWNYTKSIRDWIEERNMTLADLQTEFEKKIMNKVKELNRRPIVWEEAFVEVRQALPLDTIVEVWDNMTLLDVALDAGFDVVLGDGWYLDRQAPTENVSWFWEDTWGYMYLMDPEELRSNSTGSQEVGHVLGGEANMWSEQVSDLNIGARMWPRAAGIAERLWSHAQVKDRGLAAQRLAQHRCRLAYRGIAIGPIWADYCGADLGL